MKTGMDQGVNLPVGPKGGLVGELAQEPDTVSNSQLARQPCESSSGRTVSHHPEFAVRDCRKSERSNREVKAFPVEQPPNTQETDRPFWSGWQISEFGDQAVRKAHAWEK